ncbi:unnamed protein product, partial [Staurois parvus]
MAISAAYQCPSVLPISAIYHCPSVLPINAHQCLLISAHQCRLSVPISTTPLV